MEKKRIIFEQTDWTELSSDEKSTIAGWPDNRVVAYFVSKTPPLDIKKFKNNTGQIIWKKKLKGSSPPPPSS